MEDRAGVPVMVAGICVAGLGAIFRYALTTAATRTVNFHVLGVIIMVVGFIVLALGTIVLAFGNHPEGPRRPRPPAHGDAPTRRL
jgi:uncharacterized membrane protein YidH (DUF202 family)